MRGLTEIFRPRGKGLRKVLGDLEADVMKVVWARGQVSVRDVYKQLLRNRAIAYTTVMTTMTRLARKKLLRQKREGLAYLYTPAVTREQLQARMVGDVIDGLLAEFPDSVMSHLVSRAEREDPDKIERLARIIRDRRGRK